MAPPNQPEEGQHQAGQGNHHLPHELDLPPQIEIIDWEKIFGEQRKIIEREERERDERIEKAKTLEKGWELLRVCKTYLRENRDWKIIKESKHLERIRENCLGEKKTREEELSSKR